MKISQRFILITTVFFFAFCSGIVKNVEAAVDDWNYWSSYSFRFKLTDKLKFEISPQVRFREDAKDFFYYESVQGFSYKLNKNLDLGLYHLYADEKNSAGKWTDENRGRFQVVWKTKLGEFKFSDRNRYEYRVVDAKPKSRYRNRLKLAKPVTVFGHKITPYIANEFFYDFRVNEFNQNRASIGFSKKLTEIMTGEIYYMVKSKRTGSDWDETQIIGTALKFDF